MIDFIEYVVSELKSKRLSKTNAVALMRQFTRRASGTAAAVHPLLHRNTSDLSEQRYCSTFTGEEFFLADHQVQAAGSENRKVLPGVTYLEMARAAVEQSLPELPQAAVLELRNIVWAQPVVVTGRKEVHIALLANDDDQVDYEVYSEDGGEEFVHCQGRAIVQHDAQPATLDLDQLRREMTRDELPTDVVYAVCTRMGLLYGPAFQSVAAIRRGNGQLLAELRLPELAGDGATEFVLHPSLMDGALQAAVGMLDGDDMNQPRLPFALETLRILAPCTPSMTAWLRFTAGSQATDKTLKLDIDLCDANGNVCVQMRGFSWRVLTSELTVTATQRRAIGSVLATPVWQAVAIQKRDVDVVEHHILSLQGEPQGTLAQHYAEQARDCFERIRAILQRRTQGKVLVQVIITNQGEESLLAGISGLLRTAALENPQFSGQVILVPEEMSPVELVRQLDEEKHGAHDAVVKYENGTRYVQQWEEVTAAGEAPLAFRNDGVYLITGGLGALGVVFAAEILEKTRDARVILTGRAALDAKKQAAFDALSQRYGRVTYRQLDLNDLEAVKGLVADLGRLDGILHSAGMIADGFILRKESADFAAVLEPKVTGTYNLDQATADLQLDFFVLFSALAGAFGNLGQADYAAANAFLDGFAAYRNRQVAAGERHGRTRAIDWPLWQSGGMEPDAESRERLQRTTGMQPMNTAAGLAAFHRVLALPYDQTLVVEGDIAQIRRTLLSAAAPAVEVAVAPRAAEAVAAPRATVSVDPQALPEQTEEFLRKQFSEILKVPAQKIDPRAALEDYGIDSIVAMKLTNQLETTFGSLPKTLFFEYQTVRELAGYFLDNYAAQLTALFAPAAASRPAAEVAAAAPAVTLAPPSAPVVSERRTRRRRNNSNGNGNDRAVVASQDEPIAIVGLSGRYPEAVNLEQYWVNLRDGKDCITEVPKSRWDWQEYFNADRTKSGHHYSKWGGFIEGVDEFDPLFFNIPPVEAETIDPQERLFLQHAWMAIEDAGYTRSSLQIPFEGDLAGQVGVYAGVMYTEYQLFGAEALGRGTRMGVPGSAASIANRVSYVLNVHGPSMTVDTMCSSSLTAIHVACEDLKRGRTSLAIAGGVNVSVHPNKYFVLSQGQFISSDGHCQSFGEGGDGYIPGEGVGVVVLKRLSDAERDGDHIYAVIRGSALNHGGKTNGYSVPNPQAQAGAISRALTESKVDPRHISYIEAHGTGTKLGDPIEIAALSKAFQKSTQDTGYCLIGSAKSNIGHCESAAGIAGLTKIVLQMQHRQIVPSLHSAQLNPHIDFAKTPFIVNQTLRPWEQPVVDGRTLPRIAGISSFGAGGSNAHLILEEYVAPVQQPAVVENAAIVLSARTAEQLRQKASDLLDFVRPQVESIDLASMAWTLQTGREPMDERLAFIAASAAELVQKLEAWLSGDLSADGIYRGQVKRNNDTVALFNTDADLQQAIERWVASRKLPKLLELWSKGLELEWEKLYGDAKPRRMSLPVYPFARERYWLDASLFAPRLEGATTAVLHPLLHSNISDLSEQRFRSTFTGEEFFLADHRVAGQAVLPGVAYLEMARAAIEHALPEHHAIGIELRNTVWAQPVVVDEKTQVSIVLLAGDNDEVEYEIFTGEDEVHCQGRAVVSREAAPASVDVAALRARMTRDRLDAASVYALCARLGLNYGPSFQAIAALDRGNDELLAELRLPNGVTNNTFVLHPSLMDGALQAAVGLLGDDAGEPRLPFALETLRIVAPCTSEMVAWVRFAPGSSAADTVVKLNIDLCDASGNVCVQMHGFSARAIAAQSGTLVATPVWEASALPAIGRTYAEEHVLVLDDAAGYTANAVQCFEKIQSILGARAQGKVLLQVVGGDAGIAALLKTAALENPQFFGQLVLGATEEQLGDERRRGVDALVRYENGVRQTVRWQEVAAQTAAPVAFKEDGVYLITGGFGGLGTLFTNEILNATRTARVVLTGRSAARVTNSDRVTYRQVDLTDAAQVRQLVAETGRIDGILHSAGMLADDFIVRKTSAQFRDVLAPKVQGTINLDEAARALDLDFFVLFSSIAGVSGNAGQADYATANAFMDGFAQARGGRTRSINWPLWQDGGMTVDDATRRQMRQSTGMVPMQTASGMAAFYRALALPAAQVLVVEGDLTQLRRTLTAAPRPAAEAAVAPRVAVDAQALTEKTQEYLRKQFAGVLKLQSSKIDPQAALEEYGIDSVLAMKLTNQLEQTFGSLPKTLFFEYQTVAALTTYFTAQYAAQLAELFGAPASTAEVVVPQTQATVPARALASRRFSRKQKNAPSAEAEPIAIVGLSGRYPQAIDVEAYWNNLRDGKDCITEVPQSRWDWREYFSEDRGKAGQHYSKWGGFIEGVDEFDPLFFNISPVDAEILDPQERIFLQHAWTAMEDAGYTRASLQVRHEGDLPGQVGVYVGVMYNEYQLFAAEASARGKRLPLPGSTASIANRVSYVLNVHGPSVTLDTMCSSSLTAIHFACQDLKLGRTSLAIAGGVNVTIHPNKYLVLSAGQFISSEGACQSFGEGGDGYIPGEGVGAVVLKRLSDAERDGDHIYGVIRGSALNHGGKTNGYTVPNPQAQATAIGRALAESKTDARHVSYIEAHGTGTTLGDPIEIAALTKAFGTKDTGFCLIGSAKSNIGHCESAAGVAGLTKVLLQMQHKQIVPSLHSATLNPHIDFAASPFVVNQTLRPWEAPVVDGRTLPRIAGISSFGAGGSNAHLIIEEYVAPAQQPVTLSNAVILLSARTPEQLQQKARELAAYVRPRLDTIELASVAYTLQVGREPMEERLGLVVESASDLVEKLEAWLTGEPVDDSYQGQVKRTNDALAVFSADADLQQTIEKWIANGKVAKLLDLWAKGLEVDWSKLYGSAKPRRISLPAYPFARERYWIETGATQPFAKSTAVLHPLLHSNTSDLSEQRYRSTFTGEEFFLADHRVKSGKVLPGVAYLEMARAAIQQALPEHPSSLELRNIVWAQPIVVSEPREIHIALSASGDEQIDFEIFSQDAGDDVVHGEGQAVLSREAAPAPLDLEQLGRQLAGQLEPGSVYAAFGRMGLSYGPSFQGITAIRRGAGQVLATLRVPETASSSDYVLHPSVMDAALQAAIGLVDDVTAAVDPRIPFALGSLRIVAPCTTSMVAWVRPAAGSQDLDIDLCDERGNVCVQFRGLALRTVSGELSKPTGSLVATPVWQPSAIETFTTLEFAERHVIVCELARVDAEELAMLFPLTDCLLLQAENAAGIAERYNDYAVACFERVQEIFQEKRDGKVLVQIAIADDPEHTLFAGLSGLLKTAAQENPQFMGQLVLVPAETSAEELERYLNREQSRGLDALVRYHNGVRRVLRWQEVPAETAPVAFRDGGVYLITGGAGGLGLLFANEIVERTRDARVILTGRSAQTQVTLNDRVAYRQLDLTNLAEVESVIAGITSEYGRLDGVLHSAGMIADRFILHKNAAEFADVLAPKVTGTVNLDLATRNASLDFFVLFSSVAGATGNPSQADYATANGFMDQFAAYRNVQVFLGTRQGRTKSINWPLWQGGGMKVDRATEELLQQTTGMYAMQTATGMDAFYRTLASPYAQTLVVEGDVARLRRTLLAEPEVPAVPEKEPVTAVAAESLVEKTQEWLRREFAEVIKLPVHKIDPKAALEQYGIDSILAMRLTTQLEKSFGSLSKTLFFEYQTIAALAGYFAKAHASVLSEKLGVLQQESAATPAAAPVAVEPRQSARRARNRFRGAKAAAAEVRGGDVAIVGLAGRYPQAGNVYEFWRNLKEGRDCITEIPSERWDHSLYFDADPNKGGKSYSKWGGFISDVDKFDPLFFSISPKEAEVMDPQERLFLETAWETIEDAGYTRESIAGSRTGVFVGVMWGQYELFGAEAVLRGGTVFPGSSHASIANRVSYFFDFHGPSIALDTMCSSSLTAIHLACEALRRGEIATAIAGGVNVSIHPYKYLSLSQGKFAATDGRCRSFGAGGDGYVPGEGVGAVLLKSLDAALRDGDQIYGVLKSSSVNHGGKTNGYTVPNPNAQGELIADALKKANIDPKTLSYIETHGTGTSLGDPIEITGLLKAFDGTADAKQILPIGSVKSNIGHLEAAAGIASVTKALLQLRHQQLVPSLHATPLNPNIDFESSPFYVQTELADWAKPASHPRRVGVSSFGAGGANAHLIIEEYPLAAAVQTASRPEAIVLSAKNQDALRRYAERVVRFLDGDARVSLADLAYTFQVGRTPMDLRLAVIAASVDELRAKLNDWLRGDATELQGIFHGNVREIQYSAGALIAGPAGKAFLESLLKSRDLEKVARLWVLGADVDWSLMERQGNPRRVSLPTYPFARERYWIRQETPVLPIVQKPADDRRRTTWTPQWSAQSLAATARPSGNILVLDSSDALSLALQARPEAGTIVVVKPGHAFAELAPNSYSVDFTREEQFETLVATLASKGLLPEIVLHHDGEASAPAADQLDRGVFALFHLTRSLTRVQQSLRVVSLFASSPLGSAIGGFFKTLSLEEPSVRTKSIELEGAADTASLLWNELSDSEWSAQEIRYRNGERLVRTLVPLTAPQGNLPLRQRGVYLLTGGLGGLGIIFAEYLAKNWQACLVLTGRTAPNAEQQAKLAGLEAYGAEVLVVQADVAKRDDVERVVREAKARFGELHGVIHSAGVTRDALLARKTREDFAAVLAPKVFGTINLDEATRGEDLDFFALFSSIAGVTGNLGQCDYAFGNHFLDSFAERRAGRTLSINWPLWAEGGMRIAAHDVARLEQQTGMAPLPTQDGIAYFEELLRTNATQAVALYGNAARIASFFTQRPAAQPQPQPKPQQRQQQPVVDLSAKTEAYLKALIGEEIKLDADRIGSADPLESFGIDSVMINRINAQLERDFGSLPKTLLYEHETVRDLTAYLVRERREALVARFGSVEVVAAEVIADVWTAPVPAAVEAAPRRFEESETLPAQTPAVASNEPIAIVGMHGYYPQSETLDEYWEHLKEGRDLTEVVPANRWDAEAFAADGSIYAKWGGFVADHDKFDPSFFRISPVEAKIMDPQERLFLQSVWTAIEDAGYTRDRLRTQHAKEGSADVGVFVGVTTNSYQMWADESVSPTSLPWSIANRVSYFFDFNGPSLPIDTACSSSLVALHLASESLRNGECQVAVAGGVNLYLHPSKYQSLCQKRMLSADGKCHSYGAGDDGFVPGEGVGTVVLKPLSRAIADGDRIHAVLRASAYDHSGRSNGYSAPNPNAQASLIARTLEKAQIHPETITFVEGHGTGTQLGDSIEVAALTKAFQQETSRTQFCSIGSVKANIGHGESVAGMSGLAKVVLQMRHGLLAPSLHSDVPNPNIEFETSPFYLQHGLSEWTRTAGQPRRALINSFGAGGLNACLVVEEYEEKGVQASRQSGPYVFTLSAKNEDRLRDYTDRLVTWLRRDPSLDLASLCYTLQTGREAMEERLALVVNDVRELVDRLGDWFDGGSDPSIHRGNVGPRRKHALKLISSDLNEVAARWVAGEDVEWAALYAEMPRRIVAPTYPFARERYWVSDAKPAAAQQPAPARAASLHPLVGYNASTLSEVRFSSTLSDSEFYAVDHQVHGEPIFPGAGFLEMACVTASLASEQRVRKIRDVIWMQPLSFRNGAQTVRTVLSRTNDGAEFTISSFDEEHEPVAHSEGRLVLGSTHVTAVDADERLAPQTLKAQCTSSEPGSAIYEKFAGFGLEYGPAFRTIQEIHVNETFALARLQLDASLEGELGQYILHPSLIDGALQTIATLAASQSPQSACLPFALDELEILKPVPQTCWAYAERAGGQMFGGMTKFNIRLMSENGETLVKFTNLYVRPVAAPVPSGHAAARVVGLAAGAID